MNLSELKTFLAIVEAGSMVRAAAKLNVTQSTVTARLKTLEAQLGQTLFDRKKSGISLTGAGQRLQRYAETISELWQQAVQETALPLDVTSVCNLACHPDIWSSKGKYLFDLLCNDDANLAVSIWQGGQSDIANWLERGLVDVALSYWPIQSTGHTVRAVEEEQLALFATDPTASVIFNEGYVFVELGSEFGRQHAAFYSNADTARISFGTAELGMAHILNHGGSAYLPSGMVEPFVKDKKLFQLSTAPVFTRQLYLIYRSNLLVETKWLRPIFQNLLPNIWFDQH